MRKILRFFIAFFVCQIVYIFGSVIIKNEIITSVYAASVPKGNPFTDYNLYKCVVDSYNSENNKKLKYTHVFKTEELNKITYINCNSNIKNTTGLDKVTNLNSFYVQSNNSVSFAGLSKLKKVSSLSIQTRGVTNLDLSKNSYLSTFFLSSSGIKSINLKNNQMLNHLSITACEDLTTVSNIPRGIENLQITMNKKLHLNNLDLTKLKRIKLIQFDGNYDTKKLPNVNYIITTYKNGSFNYIRFMNCDQVYTGYKLTLLTTWNYDEDFYGKFFTNKSLTGTSMGAYSTNVSLVKTKERTIKWQDGSTGAKKITCNIYPIRIRYHGEGGLYKNKEIYLDTRKFTHDSSKDFTSKPIIYTNDNFYVRKGYTFTKWTTKEGYAGWTPGWKLPKNVVWLNYDDGQYGIGDEKAHYLDLYANWEPNTYRIRYHSNNGEFSNGKQTFLDTRTFTFNKEYPNNSTQPIIKSSKKFVSRKGYNFKGWSTKANGSQSLNWWKEGYSGDSTKKWKWVDGEYGIGNEKTHYLDLYAQWDPIHYTIKFNANEGTGKMADLAKTYGVKTKAPKNTFTRTGYTFAGWNNKADGTGSLSFKDQQEIGTITKVDGNVITLYAQWKPIKNTVKFNANGGTGTMANIVKTYGETTVLPRNTFTRTGYTFKGWNTASGGTGTSYSDTQNITSVTLNSGDVLTLYAQWNPIKYTIKFNANGGTGTMADLTKTYGDTTPAPLNTFTRTGYTFVGWNTASGGNGNISFKDGQNIGSIATENGQVITLYAQWSQNETVTDYIITYNLNGGTVNGTNPTSYNKNSAEITLINPTKEGYTFTGWTGSNGTNPETTVKIVSGSIGNRTYNAIFEEIVPDVPDDPISDDVIDYTIEYNLNGGTVNGTNPTSYNKNTPDITLINPTKSGYTFIGWIGSNGDDPETTVVIESDSIGNRQYEAIFESNNKPNIEILDDSQFELINGMIYIDSEKVSSLTTKELIDAIPNSRIYDTKRILVNDNSTLVATDYTLVNNNIDYPIIVYGDVDSNGFLNGTDMIELYYYIKAVADGNNSYLTDKQKLAADMNKDGNIDSSDMIEIYYKISGRN